MTDLNHQQQKSPDTENTETQQGGHTHHIPKETSATIRERQITHARDTDRTPTRAKESACEYAEPNTTATPQGDNPDVGSRGAASLTAIEEEKNVHTTVEFWSVMRTTHCLQNRTASANEVTPKTEPGTTSSQQVEVFLENKRNPKRTRGSDSEYTEPITMVALLGDIDTLKDTSTSRPDTRRCIQVGRETYALTSKPGTVTPDTCDPRTDPGTTLGQRPQPVTDIPEPPTQEATRRKSTKPQKPNRHKNRRHDTQGRVIDKFSSASRP